MNDEQQGLLMMYKDVAKVFDKHGIRYFGMFGTELGVIRHDGFIPWDNDIDILVMSDDMPYIKRLLTEELDQEKYYFHDSRADCHPHVILRTDNFEEDLKNRKPYFMDIFLFHPYPNDWFKRKIFNLMATGSYVSVFMLESSKSFRWYKTMCRLPRVFEKIALMTVRKDDGYMAHFIPSFRSDIFETKDFKEPLIHKFEDTTMPIPMDWEKFLLNEFGSGYMTPPPPEKRSGAHGFPVGAYFDYLLDCEEEKRPRKEFRNDGKLVSVIIPVYNSSEHLYECIRHLKQQTYQNFEVIFVVDVRCEDNSFEELNRLSSSLQNTNIIIQNDNKRAGGARNIGLDSAKGDYVWYLDVDDCPSPYFIEEMLDTALEYDADSVACNHFYTYRQIVVDPPDKEYTKTELSGIDAINEVCSGHIAIPTWNKLYRREFLIKNNLYYSSQFSEDYDYTLRTFRISNKVVYYNKPLYSYYLTGGTRSYGAGDKIARADIEETVKTSRMISDRDECDKFCAEAFRHILRSLTNTTWKTYRELARSTTVKKLSKYKQGRFDKEVFLFRVSPLAFYIIGKAARRLKYSNGNFLFDDNV